MISVKQLSTALSSLFFSAFSETIISILNKSDLDQGIETLKKLNDFLSFKEGDEKISEHKIYCLNKILSESSRLPTEKKLDTLQVTMEIINADRPDLLSIMIDSRKEELKQLISKKLNETEKTPTTKNK